MELRHLRYFVRAAELLHFTRAAESLYISQPTLSTHIQQLEEEIGLPLFNRLGRAVQLTDAGKIFLEYSTQSLRELDRAAEEIANLKGIVSGDLRLGSLLGFGQSLLPAWIADFHAAYPRVRFEIMTGSSETIEAWVKSGTVDLGLSFVPPVDGELKSQTLLNEQLVLVVSSKNPLAQKQSIQTSDLPKLQFALVNKRFAARTAMDQFLSGHNINIDLVAEIEDLQALLKLVSSTDFATILGPLAIGNYPGVKPVNITGLPELKLGMLWQDDRRLSPPAKRFFAFLIQASSSEQATADNSGEKS